MLGFEEFLEKNKVSMSRKSWDRVYEILNKNKGSIEEMVKRYGGIKLNVVVKFVYEVLKEEGEKYWWNSVRNGVIRWLEVNKFKLESRKMGNRKVYIVVKGEKNEEMESEKVNKGSRNGDKKGIGEGKREKREVKG